MHSIHSVSAIDAVQRTGVRLSALLLFVAVAAIGGVLAAAAITPAVALTAMGTKTGIGAFEDLPSSLTITALDQRSKIFARSHGRDVLLASFFNQNRDVVAWKDVSATVKNAAVAGEDVRFYQHGGVDAQGLVRAAIADALHRDIQGASTISQQYVKNNCIQQSEALPSAAKAHAAYLVCTGRSLGRKVREMRLAIGLEKKYSKNQILLGYLNIAGFGGRNYGIEAAARYYFDRSALQLTDAQAAALLAIVNNPDHFRLDVKANLPAATDRRNHILTVERDHGMLGEGAYERAVASPITTTITPPSSGCDSAGVAGFFCDYVVKSITTNKIFGKTETIRMANLQRRGWQIHTSLNLDLQRTAQNVLNRYVPMKSNAFDVGGASVSLEAQTGRVVTMVQNKKYDATGASRGRQYSAVNYNVDSALGAGGGHQPGSTFKLLTLVQWLKTGHTLYQTVNGDARVVPGGTFSACGNGFGPFTFGNDTSDEGGRQTVMAGTAASVNGVFVSMAEEMDLCDLRNTAQSMGVRNARGGSLEAVPSMSIGGASSAAPIDMATAYATIANHGVTCAPRPIDRITTPDGKPVPVPRRSCRRTIDRGIAVAAAYALRGVITGGTMSGDQTADGRYEFGKTGTTDDAKDTWAIGSTSKVTTAVWVGNAQGGANLRESYLGTYCDLPAGGSTAALQRHCIWNGIQTAVNKVYGGAYGWEYPDSQYLYGGRALTHADAAGPKPKPKPVRARPAPARPAPVATSTPATYPKPAPGRTTAPRPVKTQPPKR